MGLRFALAVVLAVSVFSLDASAQRRDGGYGGYSGITVYEDPDFRGDSVTFRDDVTDLRANGLNDRISSLQVRRQPGVGSVPRHQLRWRLPRVHRLIDDLREEGWNDRISSMRAVGYARNNNRGGWWGNDGNGNRNGNRNDQSNQAGVLRSDELPRRRAEHLNNATNLGP